MDKKVSITDVKSIIKNNTYENRSIKFDCGNKNVEVIVTPGVSVETWFSAINSGVALMADIGFEGDSEFAYSINSIAYKFSLITCFTNITEKLTTTDMISLIQMTDISDRLEKALPMNVLDSFQRDFDRVSTLSSTRHSINRDRESVYEKLMFVLNDIEGLKNILEEIPIEDIVKLDLEEQENSNT